MTDKLEKYWNMNDCDAADKQEGLINGYELFNLLIIGGVAFSSLFLSLTFAVSLINFGALLTFTLVNLSVIAHYYFRKKQRSIMGTIWYLIIPLIGASLTGLFF
ncbi:hypothetical protein [Bacillus salipaludis]|uniref:hypothetical protein n=1 Tax=Bacillus salipaludis TaxID=2547811 RepID=UPI002E1A53EE|nr:hypothetical protein [Bacillus salipaludis]